MIFTIIIIIILLCIIHWISIYTWAMNNTLKYISSYQYNLFFADGHKIISS